MTIVTLSSKFQLVIPKEIRRHLNLNPGKKYQVITFGDCIEFVPMCKIQEMRGSLIGIDAHIGREKDRL
jgi:AbrB family looped-hinge helix DNA binding protein